MADGDHIVDIWVSGSVGTINATVTTLITIPEPFTPTETFNGVFVIEAWVYGQAEITPGNPWYEKIISTGRYADGGLNLNTNADSEFTHDPNTAGWGGLTVAQSSNDILVQVEGIAATDIFWYGEAKLKVIEAELTEA